MSRAILAFVLVCGFASSACALSVEQTVGVWVVDPEADWAEFLKLHLMKSNMTDEQLAAVKAKFMSGNAGTRFTLSATCSVMARSYDGRSVVEVYKSFTSTSSTTASVVITSAQGAERPRVYSLVKPNALVITSVQADGVFLIPPTITLVRSATAAATK